MRTLGIILILGLFLSLGLLEACKPQINKGRKLIWLPQKMWSYQDTLQMSLRIFDTTKAYAIFIITHYANNYPYKNLWINTQISTKNSEAGNFRTNVTLADNNRGYLGSGMNNVYRNYSLWKVFRPKVAGVYDFRINHLMQLDTLPGFYALGIEIHPLDNKLLH